MWKIVFVQLLIVAASFGAPAEEWEPFQKSGLFRESPLWLSPDMEKESVPGFSGRLLDGARAGDVKAMATLGRFFFVRRDLTRAAEWVGKAANEGHAGAQLDFGTLFTQGTGVPLDMIEAYKWIWLATWAEVPGAAEALRELSAKVDARHVIFGVRRASAFQDARMNLASGKGK